MLFGNAIKSWSSESGYQPISSSTESNLSRFFQSRLVRFSFILGTFALSILSAIFLGSDLHARWLSITEICRGNLLIAHAPRWSYNFIESHFYNVIHYPKPAPTLDGLLDAPWPGTWETPTLIKPNCDNLDLFNPNSPKGDMDVPALAIIHVFSSAFPKSRAKRDTIRSLSMLKTIPDGYRHLIEMKFVLGRSDDVEWEKELDLEEEEFGDLVRLGDLFDGENMDHGKSFRWIRYMGREGGRKAWWVFKCDDDSIPILPNLLPWLLLLDPDQPHYVGTTMQKNPSFQHYFNGIFYGFSYNVVRTMAAANLTDAQIDAPFYEDARTGQLMSSLPSKPGQPREPIYTDKFSSVPPPSPDARTGLIRVDAAEQMTNWNMWWGGAWYSALVWHRVKQDTEYVSAMKLLEEGFASMKWKFEWRVPSRFRHLEMDQKCLDASRPFVQGWDTAE